MTLRETVWRGVPAWTLESRRLRVVTTPSVGAKITSLYDKAAGHEWLVAPPDRAFGPVAYAAPFIEQDMSGWDEMFPTIKPCAYPVPSPYAGTPLPDHGEVWALPWQVESASSDALTLSVAGRALPYRLTRTLALRDDASVSVHYAITNTGPHPLAALWAAHPQFTATPHTRIRLPGAVTELYNVRDIPAWGPWGLRYAWPEATDRNGARVRLDRIAPPESHTCRKLYVPPEMRIEWAGLEEEDAQHGLYLQWDQDEIPYLGIWVDEGAVNSAATVALEITDGFHDSLETAWANQRCPVIPVGGQRQWKVELSVNKNTAAGSLA